MQSLTLRVPVPPADRVPHHFQWACLSETLPSAQVIVMVGGRREDVKQSANTRGVEAATR